MVTTQSAPPQGGVAKKQHAAIRRLKIQKLRNRAKSYPKNAISCMV